MTRVAVLAMATLLFALSSFAQTTTFTENFEKYATGTAPAAWLDDSAGRFRTFDDPSAPGNVVYGAKHPTPKQRSVSRGPLGDEPQGAASTLSGRAFSLGDRFELRGRFYRATDNALLGVTFFSREPEQEGRRLVGMWPSMRLYCDARKLAESTFAPEPRRWYRFVIRAEAAGAAMRIRARFWPDGATEPESWTLDALDDATATRGRIGLWSAFGTSYFDDLQVAAVEEEEADTTAPAIVFSESGEPIARGTTGVFNRDARVDVTALDGSGIASLTVTLDGAPYTPGSPIVNERRQVLRARAVDNKGNAAEAEIGVVVDKTAPSIAIDGIVPLGNAAVTPRVSVSDLTEVALTMTLDGAPYVSGTAVTGEGTRTLLVSARDAAGWTAAKSATFTIDLTPPAIAFTEGGVAVTSSITRNRDAAVVIAATDAHGVDSVTATLDGAPYASGSVIAAEGTHAIVATARDVAGNERVAALTVVIDRSGPAIEVTNDGAPLPSGLLTNAPVKPVVTVTGAASHTVTLNGAPFVAGTTVDAEREHVLVVAAVDAAGNERSAAVRFTVDRTPPQIRLEEGGETVGASVTRNRDAAVRIDVTDANGIETQSALLDGAPYVSGTLITAEGTHELIVSARDRAGNEAEARLTIVIDKSGPEIAITNGGAALVPGLLTNQAVTPVVTVSGAASHSVSLNGAPFTSGTTVDAEREHVLIVDAVDAAGNTKSVTLRFTIDRTRPALVFREGGETVAGSIARNRDSAVSVEASDASGIVSTTLTVDGSAYTAGTTISAEGTHAVAAAATDGAGNRGEAALTLIIDRTKPVVTITDGDAPLAAELLTNANVTPVIAVSEGTYTATLNDAPFTSGTTVTEERAHTLAVTATDAATNATTVTARFTIDRTPPAIAFTSPAPDATVGTTRVTVTGTSDDAVRVVVNGAEAALDLAAKTFTADVDLVEGANDLSAVGYDAAGNQGTRSMRVHLDTRAPELTIASPAAESCVGAASVTISGTAPDAVKVTLRVGDGAPVEAALSGDAWTGTVPLPEGAAVVLVEATDSANRTSNAALPLRVDRTKPVVTITDNGVPFSAAILNREVAPFVRVADADLSATLTVTLNGIQYNSGTVISEERAHVLRATATDCAGNVSEPVEIAFTIDRTPPAVVAMSPASGAVVGTKPSLTGTLSEPASVIVEGSGLAASVDGTAFTLHVPLEEGVNELTLLATDRAGNRTRVPYALRVQTAAPVVEIVENGLPIAAGALFNRTLAPVIRVSDPEATLTATLNGAPFASGSAISGDGSYTLVARAADKFGHVSNDATATFTIDRTPPRVVITAPLDESVSTAATAAVHGTVDADATRVVIAGVPASLANGAFAATVALEQGANVIAVTAFDRAGNSGTARVEVTRNDGRLAIFLTSPPDDLLTNRPTTVVSGQVLTTPPAGSVRINGVDVAVDAAGAFRRTGFALHEGPNEITAAVTGPTGEVNEVSVNVVADFTPPSLVVTANGVSLADGARFAVAPQLAVASADNYPDGLVNTLTIDGEEITGTIPALADGGHALTAIARDGAGNETRADRTFFIGGESVAAGCALSDFDPLQNAAVFGELVRITGRSGGAASVLIDGKAAQVAEGTFCGEAVLVPGRNEVVIRCADASGTPTADAPVTLVLWRDAEPSIDIVSPAAGSSVANGLVTVSGTVGEGVVSGDVNGVPFTPASGTFTVADVALSPGLNVITARAKSGSGRIAVATARVTLLAATPQLAITSPLDGAETGAGSIDVTGTYVNADRSTIRVNGAVAATVARTDTSGTFAATVTLSANETTTITATGRNHAGAEASDSVAVEQSAGAPSIVITSPADNSATSATTVRVTGTIAADAGAFVQVNGVGATLDGSSFTADVPLGATGSVPLVARVTTPAGAIAADSVRVTRFAGAPAVRDAFPAANATDVERGAAIILLFTNAIDGASAASAIRLSDAAGADVPGSVFTDRDAATFAPHAPLRAGETYRVTVSTALRDLAATPLAAPHSFSFTTAATAPAAAPVVDDVATTGCLGTIVLTGRASVPGARVRLDADGVTLTTTSSDTGAFRFTFAFSGESGFHIARVRQLGSDGSLSAERALCFRNDCALPRVLNAALDRTAKTLTIDFSRPMDPSTLVAAPDGTIVVAANDVALTGSVAVSGSTATVTFTTDIGDAVVTLTVKKEVQDAAGAAMAADYTQTFTADGAPAGEGKGYVTGAVYDATTGRPLANATITIGGGQAILPVRVSSSDAPAGQAGLPVLHTNDRGRYSRELAEGAWTIEARAEGYTSAWRQIVVPAGAGVVPIDIRLARRGPSHTTTGAELTLTHGGDTAVTTPVALTLAPASLPPGRVVALTAIDAQALPGLLPLGWSPLAAAEVFVDDNQGIPGAKLALDVNAAGVVPSVVRYDPATDEWRVVVAVATISADRVTVDLTEGGHYAVVHPDAAPHLARPPAARAGAALQGVVNPCAADPSVCALTARDFTIEPRTILPSGRAVATLTIEGTTQRWPSGTAVQAYIDETLNLADGRVIADPPFATDLLVYRTPAGDAGLARFHIAPTATAAAVMLRDGIERVRIVDYPGRIDRGTLLGAEGGRVPGDGSVTIDVPAGATLEALHASASAMPQAELDAFGSIAGFRIAGGFTLSLTRTTAASADELLPPSLLVPAKASFAVLSSLLATEQVIVAEVLDATVYGATLRLVALADGGATIGDARLFTTRAVDSTQLPIDGIVRGGRYLILVAEAPIAYAHGQVRGAAGSQPAEGVAIANARVTTSLGVPGITGIAGVFVLPVPAKPAAPFALVAETPATGKGTPATAAAAPDAGAFVNFGVLPLEPQAPRLVTLTPSGGELAVDEAFLVRAEFDAAIDPASVAGGITVRNLTTASDMAGSVSAAGNIVSFNPGEPLRAASQYSVTVHPAIRGLNGTPHGQTTTVGFTTSARPRGSTELNPERIRIAIPDANGKSTISGTAGAIPAGAQAVAVRRGRFFIEAYQATAAADGSFAFDAGHGDARDRITLDDLIDLQIVDPVSRAVIAIIELTPFAGADGRSFVARHDRQTRFVSADGITVTVPAGAFGVPTLVGVVPTEADVLAAVPTFGTQLHYATGVELTFDGTANAHLEVELPVPAGADTTRTWYLGMLGESVRGPRVMLVDFLRITDGKFVTADPILGDGVRAVRAHTTGPELRKHLQKVLRSGIYAVVNIAVAGPGGLAWSITSGLQAGYDLFWTTLEALYASHLYIIDKRGTIAMLVPTDLQWKVVGIDVATGLETMSKVYDPIPGGDPGTVVVLPPADPDRTGPHPVFATPFRIETLDVNVAGRAIESVRGFTVRLQNGLITATTTLPPELDVTLLNVATGQLRRRSQGLTVGGSVGDRIVLMVEQQDVDPDTPISVVFDEAIAASDAELPSLFEVETARGDEPFAAITGTLRLRIDPASAGRRVLVGMPATLTRGNRYRLRISPEVKNAAGLRIGQVLDANGTPTAPLSEPVGLELSVRAPGDLRTSFDLPNGYVRDQALLGNILVIAKGDGGIAAYDVSNPAAIEEDQHRLPGEVVGGSTDFWSLATDHHGRIYATGITGLFGVVNSFRVEQFLKKPPKFPPGDPDGIETIVPVSGGTVSWVPGAAAGLEVGSRIVGGDRAEAYPRRIRIVVQDKEDAYDGLEAFLEAGAQQQSQDGEFHVLKIELARDFDPELEEDPTRTYAVQRITVVNETLDMRWSGDAKYNQPAVIEGIVARANDRIRVIRNQTTYGVIALFGYGIGVYDLNAIESNDERVHRQPDYKTLREQIRLTNADRPKWCEPLRPGERSIPDLTYTPDATIVAIPGSVDLRVYALDAARGLLDVTIKPREEFRNAASDRITACDERGKFGLIFRMRDAATNPSDSSPCGAYYHHPRLRKLCEAYIAHEPPPPGAPEGWTPRLPFPRFTGTSFYRWNVRAGENPVVSPAIPGANPGDPIQQPAYGLRGSVPNTDVERDYILIPGNEFGLLVAEIGGNPPPLPLPSYAPLDNVHLADVIWIPHGAHSARAIPGTSLAAVVDGQGHVLLVDLSRIDERWNEEGLRPGDELFPTVAAALEDNTTTPDPRIVWRSQSPVMATRDPNGTIVVGTLAPAIDPLTGFVFAGKLFDKTTNVIAALDPRLQIKVDVGEGRLRETGGLAPLGVPPPAKTLACDPQTNPSCNASLGAFRVEVALPGSVDEALGGTFPLTIESERLLGVKSEASPDGYPKAHLEVPMRRAVTLDVPNLRFQRGWNRWISPWIVALADPRASEQYSWSGTSMLEQGCEWCRRPERLRGLSEADGVYELYTAGRLLAVRPSLAALAGTNYSYLVQGDRLQTRLAVTPGDTVRPKPVRLAAHNPPAADGTLQETTYLHSGEVETSAVDVLADRTYLSRTIGGTRFGHGWDSSLFRRLRPLPNGNVEYRDGSGEVWLFERTPAGYTSPPGVFLRLVATGSSWMLTDQQRRQTHFDALGRLSAETDRFYDGKGGGSITRYLYDAKDRLTLIVDPVDRETRIEYDDATGMVKKITDWRGREVEYAFAQRRLTEVTLPAVKAAEGVPGEFDFTGGDRVKLVYGYNQSVPGGYNARLELAANLSAIRDPASGIDRVTFAYSGDRVTSQKWATGETATFTYAASGATVVDALGQQWTYELTSADAHDQRVHVDNVTAVNVPLLHFGNATLPDTASPTLDPAPQSLTTRFRYNAHGQAEKVTYPNLLSVISDWVPAEGNAPGTVLRSRKETGPLLPSRESTLTRDPESNLVDRIGRAVDGVAGLSERTTEQPTRSRRTTVVQDDEIAVVTKYDPQGQVTEVAQTPPGSEEAVVSAYTSYYPATDANAIARRRPELLRQGAGLERTRLEYAQVPGSGEEITARDEVRGTVTTTTLDSFGRTVRTRVADADGNVLTDERFGYDASGRLAYHARKQSGLGEVVSRIEYDAVGRELSRSLTDAAVAGAPVTLRSTTAYDFAGRTVTRTDPAAAGAAAAVERTTVDGLGRPVVVERSASGQTIRQRFAYDASGQHSLVTDGVRSAAIYQHDALGRTIAAVGSDGTKTTTEYGPWDDPVRVKSFAAGGAVIAETANFFTNHGRIRSTNEAIDGESARKTRIAQVEGGRTTVVRVGRVQATPTASAMAIVDLPPGLYRAHQSRINDAGHVVEELAGEAGGSPYDTFENDTSTIWASTYRDFAGGLPVDVMTSEAQAGADYSTIVEYDGLGRPVSQREAGVYLTRTKYDEAGNVREVHAPGFDLPHEATYDSRGLVTARTLPDGATQTFRYDALGNLTERIDEAGQPTFYDYDALGRIERVRYPDGTSEETAYEPLTGMVRVTRDRAGQWLAYTYDSGGRVTIVHDGETTDGPPLLKFDYDAGGRLKLVRNADAGIGYEEYDQLGRPRLTRTYRYVRGSGLDAPVILDVHAQRHVWSVHDGERTAWRMPAAGATPPLADDPASKWLQTIHEKRDAATNLIEQSSEGGVLTNAISRSPGRLKVRRRVLSGGGTIGTAYGFADGGVLPPSIEIPPLVVGSTQAPSGLPLWSETTSGAVRIAGSANSRDDARRLAGLRDLGTGLLSRWGYDDRGRLTGTWLDRTSTAGLPPVADSLIHADFRAGRTAKPHLSADQHNRLGDLSKTLEPLTWTATSTPAHQIAALTPSFDGVADDPREFTFTGGRRTADGRWSYTWDAFGRLKSATSADRRLEYAWDPNNRVVGRAAYRPNGNGGWSIEDRTNVLARDGLPAETTFVWDPVTDRLAAIYVQGASTAPDAAPEAGLLRQYLHGDQAYDDPLVVLTPDGTYYPIVDESGTGSVTAIAGSDGSLVERILHADAYGDAPRYLQGPVADRITLTTTRDQNGAIDQVQVRIHLSDVIDPSTLPSGARLATVRADHTLAQLTSVASTLEDPRTILWTLDAAAWNALTAADGAAKLEISLTTALRTPVWGTTPVAAAPAWSLTLYPSAATTPAQPVIYREGLATIAAAGAGARTVYAIPSLYLAASEESKTKLFTGWKAAPFVEPATGLLYFRERWLDASTGTWLTPDPRGYEDSSNQYAFARNDPVNLSDPTGEVAPALVYLGHVAVQTGVDVGIDWAFHAIGDWWHGTDTEFDWHDSLETNFSINVVTGGLGGKLKHLAKLRNPIFRKAATEGGEYAVDVAATGTVDMLLHDHSAAEAYGTAAVGGAIGRSVPMLLRGARGGYRRVAQAYNNSMFSSEVGAIGKGVHNLPKLTNPLPRNGIYSRVISRAHYEAWKAGNAPIGGPETWITARTDVARITTSRGIARRLTLLDDVGNLRAQDFVRIDFRLRNRVASGLRSAIETVPPRGYGFVGRGRTAGGAREWLMDPNAELEILNEVGLAPFK